MNNRYMSTAAFLFFIAVALGAFAGHGLQNILDQRGQLLWQLATQYLWMHAVGIFLFCLSSHFFVLSSKIFWSFFFGIVLFSGSLYALALTHLRIIGMITPIGGSLFLLGWLLFGWGLLKNETH
jgi:uncharacterized membrane protein YgdD (TMEM256/DUF423 family)